MARLAPDNTDPSLAEGQEGLDAGDYLRALIRYRWLALGVTVAVTLGVLLWTIKQPKVYEAACEIEYDPNPPRPLGHDIEDVVSPTSSYLMTREFYETQNRIIASRTVAERVVRRLGLNRDPSFLGQLRTGVGGFRPVSLETAAMTLQHAINVEPVKETRLVLIKVRDENPERAMLLANTIADAYIDKNMQDRLGSTVSALEWLGTQLDKVNNDLRNSELALHQFKEENNVLSVSMEDRQNLVANDIQRFDESLTQARSKRIQLSARLAELRHVNQADPLAVNASAVAENEAVGGLRASLRAKIAERDSLAVRYGPEYPRMVAIAAEIDALTRQLREEIDSVIRTSESQLREAQGVENGLSVALDDENRAGLELNLREIEYSRLSRERENNSKLYGLLLERTTETDLARMLRVTSVRIVDRALRPTTAVSPKLPLNLGVGVGAGLVLGIALALLLAKLDRRIKTIDDAEAIGLTVLGIMPRVAGDRPRPWRKRDQPGPARDTDLTVFTQPRSAAAECCRTIRTNLSFTSTDEPIRTLVVTSPSPGEGKTTVAISLAITHAHSGKQVLLIDTDLRRPRIHRAFGLQNTLGITSVLLGDATLDHAAHPTEIPGLFVLCCGPVPPNPSELLLSQRFRDVLKLIGDSYDIAVFDSPPVMAVTDAAVIAPQMDGVVVVVRNDSTTRDAAASTLRQLRDIGARVRGCVVNDVDLSSARYGQGSYYYQYYQRGAYYGSDHDDSPPSSSSDDAAPPLS